MVNNLISVIIPVFNSSRYLEKTLFSVLNQSHKNLDIICVDDASEDGSLEILQKYAAKDSRIHLVQHSENKGRLEARRSGVNNAKGDTIMFLDSDDTMDLALCKSALKALIDNDVDIVQHDHAYFNEAENKFGKVVFSEHALHKLKINITDGSIYNWKDIIPTD